MQELIRRLSAILDQVGNAEEVRPGTTESSMITSRDWTRLRGMRDLVLAMEERLETVRSATYCCPGLMGDELRELLESP